ncbi:hypothetical protein AB0O67_27920, partial [Streptomyces sp. NPDC086077]|uniref:hypothetical protein n=1 Tax=Streptomyces sp. NPDC086077 TaxID=3154862 RepID=UPI00342AFAD9
MTAVTGVTAAASDVTTTVLATAVETATVGRGRPSRATIVIVGRAATTVMGGRVAGPEVSAV